MILWTIQSEHNDLRESVALGHARTKSNVIREFRKLYTTEVVEPALQAGMIVTHDYENVESALPLPSTLSMLLGNRLEDSSEDSGAQLYSPFPFPSSGAKGGLNDDFSRNAWLHLNRFPADEYVRIETINGHSTLRYATADIMQSSCVQCHNAHPQTPKNDWVEGDVRGVLEIDVPLQSEIGQTEAGLQQTLLAVLGMALFFFLLLHYLLRSLVTNKKRAQQLVIETRETNELLAVKMAEREQADKLLRESNARRKSIMAASVDPMVTIDDKGIILSASDSVKWVFGWQPVELIGENIKILMPEPLRSQHDGYLRAHNNTKSTRILGKTRELTAVRKNGELFPCEITVSRVDAPGMESSIFTGIIRDVSELRRMQQDKERVETLLRQSRQREAVGTLAGELVHDFNTIMTAISAHGHLAYLDAPHNTKLKDHTREIVKETARGEKLIEELLAFTRRSGEKKTLFKLADSIREVVEAIRPALPGDTKLELDVDVSESDVMANQRQIVQSVNDIITYVGVGNRSRGGRIEITLSERVLNDSYTEQHPPLQAGHHLQLCIRGKSLFIPPEDLERLFTASFFHDDSSLGSGIEVAAVKSIIEHHAGTLSAESSQLDGTTFTLILPKHRVPSQSNTLTV